MSRSYVVGMPCLVTVHDDGRVVLEVDLTELDDAVDEAWVSGDCPYGEHEVRQDIDHIEAVRMSETPIIIEGRS